MNVSNLTPDVRRRLWQCYSLLLRLVDEAEQEGSQEADKEFESRPGSIQKKPANHVGVDMQLDPLDKGNDAK